MKTEWGLPPLVAWEFSVIYKPRRDYLKDPITKSTIKSLSFFVRSDNSLRDFSTIALPDFQGKKA